MTDVCSVLLLDSTSILNKDVVYDESPKIMPWFRIVSKLLSKMSSSKLFNFPALVLLLVCFSCGKFTGQTQYQSGDKNK